MNEHDWRYLMHKEMVKLRRRAITALAVAVVVGGVLKFFYS